MAKNELKKAFKTRYASIATSMRKPSSKVVCGAASRQLVSKVLQLRKHTAGLFLQSVTCIKKKIRKFESEDDFGERYHTLLSEPYFYESAYCHVRCNTIFPVNDNSQWLIAEYDTHRMEDDARRMKLTENITDDETKLSGDELPTPPKERKRSNIF